MEPWGWGLGSFLVLNQVGREGPIKKVAFEQRLEGGEGVDHVSAQGKGVLSRADSKSRGTRPCARHLT